MKKILIVDDEKDMQKMLSILLKKEKYNPVTASNAEEALKAINDAPPDLMLLDLNLPDMDGLEVLRRLKDIDKNLPVIMITGHGDIKSAIKAIKLGVVDYITKPFDNAKLLHLIKKTLGVRHLSLVTQRLSETRVKFPLIIQESRAMKNLLAKIEKVAPSNTPILLLGESGSGKDLIAHAIHQKSLRKEYPFFTISCSGFSSTLLESELFGHEKGAFTGADKLQHGLFEIANNGTVFMDEIGDFSLDAQSKLLHILESGEFRRVGGEVNLYTNVRIIASTNQDLEKLLKANKIRQDLYYRINTVVLNIPPLRERKEDIRVLAEYFLKMIGQEMGRKYLLSQDALAVIESYHWPGNVRQLRHTIEYLLLFTDHPNIQVTDLPNWLVPGDVRGEGLSSSGNSTPQVRPPASAGLSEGKEDILNLEEIEKQHILKVLKKTQGNRREAACLLGISEPTLYRKLKEYGIIPRPRRGSRDENPRGEGL